MSMTKDKGMLGLIQALIATVYKIGHARGYDIGHARGYEAGLQDARQQGKEG